MTEMTIIYGRTLPEIVQMILLQYFNKRRLKHIYLVSISK